MVRKIQFAQQKKIAFIFKSYMYKKKIKKNAQKENPLCFLILGLQASTRV